MTGRSIYRSMIESLQFIKGDFVVPQSFQYNFKVQIFFVTGCHFQLPVSGYHHQRRYPLTCLIKRCIAIDNRNIERDIPFLPNRKMSIRLTTYREKSGQTIGIFPVPCQIGFIQPHPPAECPATYTRVGSPPYSPICFITQATAAAASSI